MKIAGLFCLLVATVWLVSALETKETRRVREAEAVVGLLRWMRTQIACFSMPLADIYAGFENGYLEKNGFLPVLREEGLAAALRRVPLGFAADESRPLVAYADAAGTRFAAEEIRAIDAILPWYEKIEEERRTDAPRRKKLARALCATGSMMTVLLLL